MKIIIYRPTLKLYTCTCNFEEEKLEDTFKSLLTTLVILAMIFGLNICSVG